MKVLDIALKDMLRSSRSLFALMFMFVVPILVTTIFYFAFGGSSENGNEFDLPVTRVQVANLDEPDSRYGSFSAGETLSSFLQSEQLADLLQAVEAPDEASARQAVDDRDADVAVIIPSGFTAALFAPDGESTVTIYQDPTLTLEPSIVKGMVSQFVDGFAGTKIAAGVAFDQLTEHGVAIDGLSLQSIAMKYAEWSAEAGESQGQGKTPVLEIQSPTARQQPASEKTVMVSLIMISMMIFFVFFTGAAFAETIIQEEELGTLPRLFTTATPVGTILAGKFGASIVTLLIQMIVLLIVSALTFKVYWGEPVPAALMILSTAAVAAGFGVFLMSFLKTSRQAGIIYGGVMTVTAMLGGLFTAAVPGVPKAFDVANLCVPQGWALRGWKAALAGGGMNDILVPVVMMIIFSIVFFVIGTLRFRKRFA